MSTHESGMTQQRYEFPCSQCNATRHLTIVGSSESECDSTYKAELKKLCPKCELNAYFNGIGQATPVHRVEVQRV